MSTITLKLSRNRSITIEAEPSDSIATRSIDAMLDSAEGIRSLSELESVIVTPEAYQHMVYRNLIERHHSEELKTFMGSPVKIERA